MMFHGDFLIGIAVKRRAGIVSKVILGYNSRSVLIPS